MTQWAPVWRVKIDGTDVTDSVIANLTITSGRTNIYTQAQAGYCSITLIIFGQSALPYEINDTISVEVQDTSAVYVPIFGGSVVDISVSVSQVGSSAYTQEVTITALGALARLQKALTNGVLTQDFDGNQIETILRQVLFAQWQQVPAALQWNTYDPTTTWANAGNTGYGEIDTPGNYELAQRASDRTVVYDLVAALATSGLGYLYEDAQGLISYGDSTHRTTYLATYGYTDLTANQALGQGITIKTRAGDVRNDLTIRFGTASANQVSATDEASIGLYGDLAQIITTTIKHSADATDQADFYLALRAYPQPIFDSITYALTNPELEDVKFLGYDHRHIFHFRVDLEVKHDNRDVEFIQMKRWLESLYQTETLKLDYRSCEMMSDDLAVLIKDKYPDRKFKISVSEDNEKIFIQIRDPFLSGWDENAWVKATFLNTLCHEFIHACQALTGRDGFAIPHCTYNPEIPEEEYYFEPAEVEARALADFYRHLYANDLV